MTRAMGETSGVVGSCAADKLSLYEGGGASKEGIDFDVDIIVSNFSGDLRFGQCAMASSTDILRAASSRDEPRCGRLAMRSLCLITLTVVRLTCVQSSLSALIEENASSQDGLKIHMKPAFRDISASSHP